MSTPREEILAAGVDDWVSLSQAEGGVRDALPELDKTQLRRATIDTIEAMMDEQLLEVGELTPRFEPWSSSSVASIAKLRREWPAGDAGKHRGFDWWLRLTPSGKEVGRHLRDEAETS